MEPAYITAAEAAIVLECDPQDLRNQARVDPIKLGFPVVVIGSRVKIPRKAFFAYLNGMRVEEAQ